MAFIAQSVKNVKRPSHQSLLFFFYKPLKSRLFLLGCLDIRRFDQRQRYGEGRAFTLFRGYTNNASVQVGQTFNDRQTEPDTLCSGVILKARERLEDQFKIFFTNAAAFV